MAHYQSCLYWLIMKCSERLQCEEHPSPVPPPCCLHSLSFAFSPLSEQFDLMACVKRKVVFKTVIVKKVCRSIKSIVITNYGLRKHCTCSEEVNRRNLALFNWILSVIYQQYVIMNGNISERLESHETVCPLDVTLVI